MKPIIVFLAILVALVELITVGIFCKAYLGHVIVAVAVMCAVFCARKLAKLIAENWV